MENTDHRVAAKPGFAFEKTGETLKDCCLTVCDVPGFGESQLTRGVERRYDQPSTIAHMTENGALQLLQANCIPSHCARQSEMGNNCMVAKVGYRVTPVAGLRGWGNAGSRQGKKMGRY